MAGIHFDITADDTNFQEKLNQVKEGVNNASKVISQLGKNFDVSSIENKVVSLNKVIKDNELSITALSNQIKQWDTEAKDAFNNGDMDLFNSITRDIEEQAKKIQDLINETENYKSALSVVEASAGMESSQPMIESPQLFKSQEDYEYVQKLREGISDLQSQISDFDGSDSELQVLQYKLSSVESELRNCESAAADAASKLGVDLGSRAVEASTKLYDLNSVIKKQSKTVNSLSQSVDKAKEELEALKASGDSSAIEMAQVKYDALSISLQNASNELRNLQAAQVDASANWANVSVEVEKADSVLVKLLGGQEKYNTIMAQMPPQLKSIASGITGMTGAAKAFIATPLGAVIAALVLAIQALNTWFNSTVEGQIAFAEASGYVSGVLGQLKEIVITVGKAIYSAFSEPKQAIYDLWDAIETNIVNRFKAVGESAAAVGKIVKAAFTFDVEGVKSSLKELTDSLFQFGTGIEHLTDKTVNWISGVNDAAKATAEIGRQSKELEIEVSKWEKESAELDKIKAEAQQKMYNTNLSSSERKKALDTYKNAVDKQMKQELDFQDRRIALQERKMSLTSNTIEDENKLRKLQADRTRIEVNARRELASLQRRSNTIEGSGSREVNAAIKNQQKLSEQLLSIRQKNQQDEIDLMEEGAEKKLKQIDLDYDRQINEIRKKEKEWRDAQGGGLTDEQSMQISIAYTQAKEKRDNEVSSLTQEQIEAEKRAMNEYLKEYGDYMEKRQAITELYSNKISEAATKGEKLLLRKEFESSLKDLDFENFKNSINFADVFGNLDKQTTSALTELRDKLKGYINQAAKDLDPEDLKELQDAFTNIDLKIAEKDPFGELKSSLSSYKSAQEAVNKAQEDLNTVMAGGEVIIGVYLDETGKLVKELLSQEQAERNLETAQANRQETLKKLTASANAIGTKGMNVVNAGNQVVSMLENFGVELPGVISDTLDGIGQIMGGLEKIDLTKPFSAITGSIGILSGIGNTIASIFGLGNKDAKNEKRIQKLQDQIDILDKSYEKLGESIEKAYSNDASVLIEDQNKLLEQQKILIQQQIHEEESKKNTDNDRIKEWQEQIEDINKVIDENKEKAKDAIFGEDLQSAIEDFAEAYADAWSSGEDRAKSAKDVVKNMIKSMINESIKAAASDPMREIREKLLEFWEDNYISGWEQDYLNKMATDLQEKLDNQFGWADEYLSEGSSTSQQSTGKGFETMSQDTASELNGRFTAFQMSNEEIKNQMIAVVIGVNSLISISTDENVTLNNILIQHVMTNSYLEDMVKYSKTIVGFGSKLDKIVEQTR